jgi:hypothetical protein
VHPFFGGKDYGRLAILGEFQLLICIRLLLRFAGEDVYFTGVNGCTVLWMRTVILWNAGGSGADGRYYLNLVGLPNKLID